MVGVMTVVPVGGNKGEFSHGGFDALYGQSHDAPPALTAS